MPLPFPTEWIANPPRYIVSGDGSYASALTVVLNGAVRVSDEVLEAGIASPGTLKEERFVRTPLREALEAVIVILQDGECENSLLWRHRRLWTLPGCTVDRHGWRLDRVRWLFIAADERQAQDFSRSKPLGGEGARKTFENWRPRSYQFIGREAGLERILANLAKLQPVRVSDWIALLTYDNEVSIICDFQQFVDRTFDPQKVAEQLPFLRENIHSLSWERFFPPPQHRWANQMRRWLAVTQPDTPWLEEGKLLLSTLQL